MKTIVLKKVWIMKRAWVIRRAWAKAISVKVSMICMSECLKQAWEEAQSEEPKPKKITKEVLIERLETIIKHSPRLSYCDLYYVANDWVKYGKNRTYFKIVEKSKDYKSSKHCKGVGYGYLDNITGQYVVEKYDRDMFFNLDFGGNKLNYKFIVE